MERDCFTCTNCGSKKDLEVHHVKPFRTILHEVESEMGLSLSEYDTWDDDVFEQFRENVVTKHKLHEGITLCAECHKK